jgi:hypothetical protein
VAREDEDFLASLRLRLAAAEEETGVAEELPVAAEVIPTAASSRWPGAELGSFAAKSLPLGSRSPPPAEARCGARVGGAWGACGEAPPFRGSEAVLNRACA